MRKFNIVFIIATVVVATGCGSTPGTDSPDAGTSDCRTNPDAGVSDAKPVPPLAPCPFVCGGNEVVVASDGSATCANSTTACAPEQPCSAVFTHADRLVCDSIRAQDGTTFVGLSNDCMVQRRDGTWTACYTAGPAWFCAETCTGSNVLTCPDPNNESCTCTKPNGDTFGCISSV